MAKFNRRGARAAAHSPIVSGSTPTTLTYEGGPGHVREAKGELFLLAVANMVGEDTFYEAAGARDGRFRRLVHQVAVEDGAWFGAFVAWLRSGANMRSASVVAALEGVKARRAAGIDGGNRQLVAGALQRADEPAEALAYWTSRYGRAIPQPVKRGIADAARRLFTEYSVAKYDGSGTWRIGDVLDLVHPAPVKAAQGDLFKHALDRRHGRGDDVPATLPMLRARAELLGLPVADRRGVVLAPDGADRLKAAGMTWESLAGWLQGPMDANAWEAVIPSMGIMALARNLRNFDEAGVSDAVAARVAARFADPAQVARSRMFPFRWWQAYQAAPSLRWAHALDKALTASTANVPAFPGRTLVLVDTSASMAGRLSGRSTMSCVQAAALFGVALSLRGAQVDLHGFADGTFQHVPARGGSVLKEMDRFVRRIGEVGHGTQIAASVKRTYAGHDRVIILSDMQTFAPGWGGGNVTDAAPPHVPMYGFNLAGYRAAAFPSGTGTRHELGGMTDATFRMIPLLEAGQNATWPWAEANAA